MNEERFIKRTNWVQPVQDLQHHYQLLFHANKHLGHTALTSLPQPSVEEVFEQNNIMTKMSKRFSPVVTKSAVSFYDSLSSLKKVVKRSHEVLVSATTVMTPANLFPDTVVVDRTKITITKRTFFWSSSVISVRIEDVLNVGISTGPLFGSLTISSRVMNSTDHFTVSNFWRHDALMLKHVIQGYMIAQQNKIDTKDLSRQELIETLLEIGNDSE